MRVDHDPHGVYSGDYDPGGLARLWYQPLPGRQPEPVAIVQRHSPNGVAWGYKGNGAADAALSILAHATSDAITEALYQRFKHDVIAQLPTNQPFRLPMERITGWLQLQAGTREPARPAPTVRTDVVADLDNYRRGDSRARQEDESSPGAGQPQEDPTGTTPVGPLAATPGDGAVARWSRLWERQSELTDRERQLDQREMRLDARARALESQTGITPAWSAPAEPIRVQIRWLIGETGDPLATVAKGLNVEPEWAAGVLDGSIDRIDINHIQRICEALHCNPYDLWGTDVGRSLLHCYGPELWPHEMDALPGGYRDWGPPDNGPPPPAPPPPGPPSGPQPPTLGR